MERTVYCEDALEWMQRNPVRPFTAYATSLPDFSEFPHLSLAEWKHWFTATAELILSRTPPLGVAVFFQTDIKTDGIWVDKAYLIQKAAETIGTGLLWHKIVARAPPGSATYGKPSFSHLLAFSAKLCPPVSGSTADVIAETGEKTWTRGTGIHACLAAVRFIATHSETRTLINPFAGHGSFLAAANHVGLEGIGIERSSKRAETARHLRISANGEAWIDATSLDGTRLSGSDK